MIERHVRHYDLRIVIPVLNEGEKLTERLRALQSFRADSVELVVVDGGSIDDSWARAKPWVDRLIISSPGRSRQMNAGAADTQFSRASALLFLHADTQLPKNALEVITQGLAEAQWGRFDVGMDSKRLPFQIIAAFMNFRSRWSGIATGDQAIFVQTALFKAVGGFPEQALMEDIELSKRLKTRAQPYCPKERVTTSARRWEKHGIYRTVVLMWRLRLAYFLGASPATLARTYGYRDWPQPGRAQIAILAKAPVAGYCKTRLIPLLGANQAARQQRAFILQTIQTALTSQVGQLKLWCAPNTEHRSFIAIKQFVGITCQTQPEGDIGERMNHCVIQHFSESDVEPLIIVGTDCMVLSPGHFQWAAQSLQSNDVCLIPAEDGGYVLIGVAKPMAEIFAGIDWSTDRVMDQTRERLRRLGVRWQELPELWDIDEPEDWQRWDKMKNLAS